MLSAGADNIWIPYKEDRLGTSFLPAIRVVVKWCRAHSAVTDIMVIHDISRSDAESRRAREAQWAEDKRRSYLRRRWTLLASSVSIAVALGGVVTSFFTVVEQKRRGDYASESVAAAVDASRRAAQSEASRLAMEVERLRASNAAIQESLAQAIGKGAKVQIGGLTPQERDTLSQTATIAGQLDKRMLALETAILQTPEKAVAVPLLRQQLIDLQDRTHGDVDGVRGEISRLYTMLQWLLGLMVTIIIGVGGLIANSLRQIGERKRETPRGPEREVAAGLEK
jgi:hypothetical protein